MLGDSDYSEGEEEEDVSGDVSENDVSEDRSYHSSMEGKVDVGKEGISPLKKIKGIDRIQDSGAGSRRRENSLNYRNRLSFRPSLEHAMGRTAS